MWADTRRVLKASIHRPTRTRKGPLVGVHAPAARAALRVAPCAANRLLCECLIVSRWPQAHDNSRTRREGSTRQQAGARASRRQRARAAPSQHTLDLGAALQAAEQRAEERRAAAAQRNDARKARRLARDTSASGGVAEQQALAGE